MSMSWWRKGLARSCALGALSLYLEMAEQIGQTQGAEEYCRRVPWWILDTRNAEIPSIIGTTGWISVIPRLCLEEKRWAIWCTNISRKKLCDRAKVACALKRRGEQFGAPTFPGRNYVIGLKFEYILGDTALCSTPISWPDWTMSSWRKMLAKFCALGAI